MDIISKIQNYHNACYSALFVLTHEENRFVRDLLTIREKAPDISIHEWDLQNGLVVKGAPAGLPLQHPDETATTSHLLEYIQNYKYSDSIFVLKDFHLHFDKTINIRLLRNAWNNLKRRRNIIIFVGHKFAVPAELQKEIQLLDYDLPNASAIQERLLFIKDSINKELEAVGKPLIELDQTIIENAVDAAKGMTHLEVENAFAMAYITAKRFDSKFVEAVFQEKIAQLKKNGLLTYLEPNISFDNVGGLQGLKTWLISRKKAYSKEAREYGLPLPKGMLLASVPGTGNILL